MFKFTELEKANIIAIDTETCDPRLKNSWVQVDLEKMES
jgi:hypothetical protein